MTASFAADPTGGFVRPESRLFFDAWRTWRGERLLPVRSQIDLGAIRALLPNVTMIERTAGDDYVIRLAGTGIRALAGRELTGRPYRDTTDPAQWPMRERRANTMLSQPCGAHTVFRATAADGMAYALEIVTLPLAGEQDRARFLLSYQGLNAPLADPAAVLPRRFATEADQFRFIDIGAGAPASG